MISKQNILHSFPR